MKSLILLACTLIVCVYGLDQSLVDEIKTQIQEYGLECAESEKATAEDIEALMNRKAPPTHQGKCVIFCVGKKMNLMSEDGKPIAHQSEWLEKLKANDPDLSDKVEKLYEQCKEKVVSTDGCDASFELVSCAKTEGEKAGLDKYIY